MPHSLRTMLRPDGQHRVRGHGTVDIKENQMTTHGSINQIKNNAEVSLPDGTKIGRIDRVVLDPRTREISHIVVRKGLLFTTDTVVPADWMTSAGDDGVILNAQAEQIEALSEFEEEAYVDVSHDERPTNASIDASPVYWYPLGMTTPGNNMALPPIGPATETIQYIPEGSVALKEGAKVLTRDDKHVGNVDEVLTDALTERVVGLVISQGILFKEKRRVPITWVDSIDEDQVRLLVGPGQLEALGFQAK